ncbi:MAG: DUF975 family protein [Faecalicoccus sp.]|nr:DUF975 family protein [Faecalicoccus sp.]
MINRQELKLKGKNAFRNNYWPCVCASIVLTVAVTGIMSYSTYSVQSGDQSTVETAAAALVGGISIIGYLLLKPLETGGKGFFLKNSDRPASLNELARGYTQSFFNGILTYFLRDLFIALWSILLVIPGIMKAYSYRMVPYILAENPDISPREALNRSSAMMNGYKMEAFMFDLSFIGWYLLAAVTLGLAGILYGNPYRYASDAELYKELRNRA